MKILAVDPGPTTGFAVYDDSTRKYSCWMEELFGVNSRLVENGAHDHLWNVLSTVDFDILIVEKFEFRKDDVRTREKIDLRAAEFVGVCMLYAQQNPHVKLVMQGSNQACGTSSFWGDWKVGNQRLRTLGVWDSKAHPHGIDALRHLMYYVTFTLNDKEMILKLR